MAACYGCNEETENFRCAACNAIQSQKARDGYESVPSPKRCKTCGLGGHYAKTCGKRDPLRISGPFAKHGATARARVELGGWDGFCALWSYVAIARRAIGTRLEHVNRIMCAGKAVL